MKAEGVVAESGFVRARASLKRARQLEEEARRERFRAREKARRIQADERRLERLDKRDARRPSARWSQLDSDRRSAERLVEASQRECVSARGALLDHLLEFGAFSDPRRWIAELSDDAPFLLMPVRLETRFMRVGIEPHVAHELWVRVYPDDVAVDAFEPVLSEDEVLNARSYWVDVWRAGKQDEGRKRAAWRSLVGSHGSGRSRWILENHQPVNKDDQPDKVDATDVILVIPTETAARDGEIRKITDYWVNVWKADGKKDGEAVAWDALRNDLGEQRAAELVAAYRPANLKEDPPGGLGRSAVNVTVAVVIFPSVETRSESWTRAARVDVMPDRFVFSGFTDGEVALEAVGNVIRSPLAVGPDPSAAEGQEFRRVEDEILVGEDLRWMVDFEAAVEAGMGLKLKLTADQFAKGFDRLLVLGVCLASDKNDAKEELELLLQHHQDSRSGFELLPQGTPTNNTEKVSSGRSSYDDPDVSYDAYFKPGGTFTGTSGSDALSKTDGQWLAEYLGIDGETLSETLHGDGMDQAEARAMNIALWPATLGYFMDSMMSPVFGGDVIEQARWFFQENVLGRGLIPAMRVGRQPYGILATTAFGRLNWESEGSAVGSAVPSLTKERRNFLERLSELVRKAEADWSSLRDRVARVGKAGDPHQSLLDILGLCPASVEFYQRYCEDLFQLYNTLNLAGLGDTLMTSLDISDPAKDGKELLRRFGYAGAPPEILDRFWLKVANRLKGPVVDDRPLSETDSIRPYTSREPSENYIAWLAKSDLETIRLEQGFKENQPPTALLYIYLRHAIMLGYWDASLRLYESAKALEGEALRLARVEPKTVRVSDGPGAGSGRWRYLCGRESAVTGERDVTVAEFVREVLGTNPETGRLKEQIRALDLLQDAPTARLERVFAEHIDCLSYRLDAWKLGLIGLRLAELRASEENAAPRQGIYLGMFGVVEDLRPENRVLEPVELDGDLRNTFNPEGAGPLVRDNRNKGHVHAPSLNHAVTAAVLRSAYADNADPSDPGALSVNLSSARVRRALALLDGIRSGNRLGALLGYSLERGLHDRHNEAEVDVYIFALRKAFPLASERFDDTRAPADVPIEAVEARNVIDGLALVNHIQKTRKDKYPFGLDLPGASQAQASAINAEIERLFELHDSLADLALAESVHQVVQGNFERAASTLDAFSKGGLPDIPDVARTPRSGIGLTHRVGLNLAGGTSPQPMHLDGAGDPEALSPRAFAEPALNAWLGSVMPSPSTIACQVRYMNEATGSMVERPVTGEELGLQPIDLLYVLNPEIDQAMTALDDRVLRYIFKNCDSRPDVPVTIRYTPRMPGLIPFFEVAALVRSLRSLLLGSRPLRPSDFCMAEEAAVGLDEAVLTDPQRLESPLSCLRDLGERLLDLLAAMDSLPVDRDARREAMIRSVDGWIDAFCGLGSQAAAFGIPQAGFGFAYGWTQRTTNSLLEKVGEVVHRWQGRLAEYERLMVEYDELPDSATNTQRFRLLQQAELCISGPTTYPLPPTPDQYKDQLAGQQTEFVSKKGELEGVRNGAAGSVAELYGCVKDLLPLDEFDLTGLDLQDIEDEIVRFVGELQGAVKALETEMAKRIVKADKEIQESMLVASSKAQAEILVKAAKVIFGEEFLLIPKFSLPPETMGEWQNALGNQDGLLGHLRSAEGVDFPVDDWLYGVARVREKMRALENVTFLTNAFATNEPNLAPVQFPYEPETPWLAMAYPADTEIVGEHILYTAHYADGFQVDGPQCGLLLDEWTEKIPATQETTGIAFHYDRPNSEPPQVMLLVVPPEWTGHWRWGDLVDGVTDAVDSAVLRAIEPDHVEKLAYAGFLPATAMAVTRFATTISANLAWNNNLPRLQEPEGDA